jgi:hypothetical protein
LQGSASIGSSVCVRHIALQEVHPSRVSLLSEWASALSSRFSTSDADGFPCAFRRLAFASRDVLFPLRISAFLAVRFPDEDLNGVATFRIGEVRPGRALPILRGLGVHEHGGNEPCSLTHPPLAPIHGGFWMTKPHREFTCVRPFGLSRACGSVMVGCSWADALGFAPRRYQRRTPG